MFQLDDAHLTCGELCALGQCCTQTSPKVTDEVLPQLHGSWGCCNGLGATRNSSCASECFEMGFRNWDSCMAMSGFRPARASGYLWILVSVLPFYSWSSIFCGNVPKMSGTINASVCDPDQASQCVSSYPSLKLAAQQFSIMETWTKAPTPIKRFEVCMSQHLLSNSYKAQGF